MASSVFIGFFPGGSWSVSGTTLTISGSISVTGQFLADDGTVAVPSYSFTSDPDTGWYTPGVGEMAATVGGVALFDLFASNIRLTSTTILGWASGDGTGTSTDTALSRAAANRLRLATGDVFNLAPTAFTSLPTGSEGDMACVTDSNTATWGATIAGGGANNVLAYFNGSNWTVAGA